MMPLVALIGVALVSAACAQSQSAATEFTSQFHSFRVVTVAEGLEHPWGLAFLPDGRMLVTERGGRLRLVGADGRLSEPIAGVPPVYAEGQGGLLDVALAPDFARSRMIYLTYAEPGPDGTAGTATARGRLESLDNLPTPPNLQNLQIVFRQQPKVTGGAHFGSRLAFTRDGYLFITTGDRQRRDFVQDSSRQQGKVIRVHISGERPGEPEIWSYGHRNIQGATLHPETGALWTVEHGARGGDELNAPKQGRNYGWPVITYGRDYSGVRIGEGTAKPGMEQPIHYWDPSIAPSGLLFYTGDRFPAWKGDLFVGALGHELLVRLELDGERVTAQERLLERLGDRIRDVRQGPDGFIYLLTDEADGRILRLEPTS